MKEKIRGKEREVDNWNERIAKKTKIGDEKKES